LSDRDRATSVFVVSAPSGAGKSTVLARVLREVGQIRFSVSHTTRQPRDNEKDGVDYHFVDRGAFEALCDQGKMLESAQVHGQLYGTGLAELERAGREGVDLLLDIDVQGADLVRRKLPDAVTVFILPPSFEELERRLRGRGMDSGTSIRQRLDAAREEMTYYGVYDYAIVNDDLDACVESLKCVIRAARCRASRMQEKARTVLMTFQKETSDR
jgi:guanylate kinase